MLQTIKWVVATIALIALRTHSLPGKNVHTTFTNHAGSGLEIYWIDVDHANNLIAMLEKPIADGETNSVSLHITIILIRRQIIALICFLRFSISRSLTALALTSLC
jgi:hypothetical protein